MNLNSIKNFVLKNVGLEHKFLYKGLRNQSEEFIGAIIKVYPSIFIIELNDGTIKSFSYNDVVINNLKILS